MKLGEEYTPLYNCAHAVATEYASVGVELGDVFDTNHFTVTFVRNLRKVFHRVEHPKDWDLVVMLIAGQRHIGVIRYGRVKHNFGVGASGSVVSDDLGYIKRRYKTTFWRLNDHSNLPPDRIGMRD